MHIDKYLHKMKGCDHNHEGEHDAEFNINHQQHLLANGAKNTVRDSMNTTSAKNTIEKISTIGEVSDKNPKKR